MIIEWIINALVTIIKIPLSLLHLPDIDISEYITIISPYIQSGVSFVRFFFDDVAVYTLTIALSVIVIFKIVDLISTIVGFFKKTGD